MRFELGIISKISVVHIQIENDKMYFHYLQLKKVKDDVVLCKRGERYTEITDLLEQIKTAYPVLLHFTGKGILNRQTEFKENYRRTILLNGNIDSFYFTDYIEDKNVFSSVIRRDVVDKVISDFATLKMQVISVTSGPFTSALLVPILGKSTLNVADYVLHFSKDKLCEFEKDQSEIKKPIIIGEDTVLYSLICCAGVGVRFFSPSEKVVLTENVIFSHNLEEARQKNLFKRFSKVVMVVFLVLLTINYFYLGHLNQVIVDNSIYLQDYDEKLNLIAELKNEKLRKESLLKSSGVTRSDFLSFYLMEIGNSTPSGIVLERLVLRPALKEIKKKEKIEFDDQKIQLEGWTNSSKGLNEWIKEIEDKTWVKSVDINDYEFVQAHGEFKLEMIID